ncbi:MAG TPA: hypothetical protein VNQ78_19355 [Paracoccus sp. (in: a-proteobacteria)]|uniref:hypothetical protein n=1 Tax=Paracoccus sp. TaxID=267 RepID=UPI002BB0969A|nr:hypothetical protein [Paracoccus sp. (in: a-proteobacteria)]HWL58814.1 hypothetical protein [Paracoccus sp. (in: a-proteobacteria)]
MLKIGPDGKPVIDRANAALRKEVETLRTELASLRAGAKGEDDTRAGLFALERIADGIERGRATLVAGRPSGLLALALGLGDKR